MAVTLDDFRAEFPEFSGVDATVVQAKIMEALEESKVSKRATLNLAAHLVALIPAADEVGKVDAGAGVVKSETVGPFKTDYETMVGGDAHRAFYATTSYGRRFLALESRAPGFVVSARVVS